jgi:hypothetical protein
MHIISIAKNFYDKTIRTLHQTTHIKYLLYYVYFVSSIWIIIKRVKVSSPGENGFRSNLYGLCPETL